MLDAKQKLLVVFKSAHGVEAVVGFPPGMPEWSLSSQSPNFAVILQLSTVALLPRPSASQLPQ